MNLLNAFRQRRPKPKRKIAKIVFNDMFDIIPVDNHFMKIIKLYLGDDYIDSEEYSDVIVDELISRGIPVRDETLDMAKFVSGNPRVLGEVEFV